MASRRGKSARHLAGNLDARRVGIDALPAGAGILVVATPPDSHESLLTKGLAGGACVLVEKPLTTTLASADRMVVAAAAPGAPSVVVAENLLHSPYLRTAMEKRREMGQIGHLSARAVQPSPRWGHFLEPLEAGGVLFDLGPHPIALVVALAHERPVGVSARLSSTRSDGADDTAELGIRFESGLVAQIEAGWSDGDAQWAVQAASEDAVVRVELTPEPFVEFNGCRLQVGSTHDVVDPRLEYLGYVDQLLDLADRAGPLRGQSVQDARDVLEIICAGYASARINGAEVDLPFEGDRTSTPMQLWRGRPADPSG